MMLLSAIGLSTLAFGLAINHTAAQDLMRLRSLAAATNRSIGAAVQYVPLRDEQQYSQVLASEFSMLSPENALKMRNLRPAQDRFDFSQGDFIVNFAQANGMKVRANTLIWYKALPTWMENRTFTRDELMAIMREHITTVVSRYRGKVQSWDVVNEAVNSQGTGFRSSVYYNVLGPEYIEMAFRWAHEADPDALLFYNDYSGEEINAKSDYIYNMVKSLVEKGVPIHGVGLQMHLIARIGINTEELAANIQRIADLGLQVHITEMDVRIADYPGDEAQRLAVQADIYRQVMQVCADSPACTAFVTWGFTDKYSWIDERFGEDDPLLFDDNYQPKPAFYAVSQVLGESVVVEPPVINDPAVVIETSPRIANPGDQVEVTVRLLNVSEVYGLQTDCRVDPNILSASGFDAGEIFTLLDSFYVGQTPNDFDPSTGQWLVVASRLQPAPAFAGDGTAFKMRYQAKQISTPEAVCNVMVVDSNGLVLPVTVLQASQTPAQPTASAEPPAPAATQPPAVLNGISGIVSYQSRADSSGIKVQLLDVSQSVLRESITTADGGYSLSDIVSGEYTLRFSGPQHLDLLRPIVVSASGTPVEVESNKLRAGDIDGSGSIDIIDAMFIAANLGLDAIPEIAYIDLNADSQINVRDLVLVGSNFGLVGPVVRTGL
jgi:endo-1,4-beta-xylanase